MANRLTDKVFFFEEAVTDIHAVQKYALGTLRDEEGKKYRYCQLNDSTVTLNAGHLAYAIPTDDWVVTGDVSDTDCGLVVGTAQGTWTNAYFGWIQRSGYDSDVKRMASAWAKGDAVFAAFSSTSDGKAMSYVTITASSTNPITRAKFKSARGRIGNAAAAVSSTTATGGVFLALE